MKSKTSGLAKQLIALAPMAVLLLLFQACFSSFVGCINGADVQGYTSVAIASLAVGAGFIFFTVRYAGDSVSSFIFAVLLMLGTALQATLNNISRNMLFTVASLIFMLGAFFAVDMFVKKSFIDKYRKLTFIVLSVVCFGIMGLLVLFGTGEDGTKSWLRIGGSFSIQLTEFFKPLFVCFMSAIFASRHMSDKTKLTAGTVLMGIIGVLMLYVGEMGTLLVLGFVYIIMAFLFIKNRKTLWAYLLLIAGAVVLLALAISFIDSAFAETENALLSRVHHVAERLMGRWNAYVNPEDYKYTYADQVLDAQKAMAKGGFLGSNTNLKVYSFESDMIFPYVLMRLGIIAGLLVIAAFTVFYIRSQKNVARQKDIYRYAFNMAVLSIIMMQTLIIAFGSLNFIPLTGIPMPLLSAGGTAMMINFAFFGLLIRESCRKEFDTVELIKGFMNRDEAQKEPSKKINRGKRTIIRPVEEQPGQDFPLNTQPYISERPEGEESAENTEATQE